MGGGHHWHHLANTIDFSVRGGDAASCQITVVINVLFDQNRALPVLIEDSGCKSSRLGGVGYVNLYKGKVKGKVFPYSLPSVGPGADPGVQAVSPQVT